MKEKEKLPWPWMKANGRLDGKFLLECMGCIFGLGIAVVLVFFMMEMLTGGAFSRELFG